jgi:hypothetical protein
MASPERSRSDVSAARTDYYVLIFGGAVFELGDNSQPALSLERAHPATSQ